MDKLKECSRNLHSFHRSVYDVYPILSHPLHEIHKPRPRILERQLLLMSDLVLRETPAVSTPKVKPHPKSGSGGIHVPFEYTPSDDGTDENLLILLHGLGK